MDAEAGGNPSRRRRAILWLDIGVLALVAAAVRLPALFTDFWFDEVFSYEEFARRAKSVLEIFLSPTFKHDNNHHLNTLFLYLLRDQPGWVVYRLPALVSGILAVALATVIGNRRSRVEGLLSGLLVAMSFMMVVYSTEARGYALALLFALLAFLTLSRYLRKPSARVAACFWVWIALGLAAHSSIAHFYIGALLWSGYRLRGRPKELAWLHVVPITWGGLWAVVVLWGSRVGGGDPWTWRQIADQSLAWSIGYPLSTVPAALAIALAIALVVWDFRCLWVDGSDEGLFYVGVILGPPVLITALAPPWLFPRYFLMSLLFLLLVLARALARLWRQPTWGKPLSLAFLLLLLLGNVRHTVPFSQYGRGSPSQAVRYIIANSPNAEILVTSKSLDLWSSLPIQFYERKLGLGERIHNVPTRALAPGAAVGAIDWVIVQSEAPTSRPVAKIELPSGGTYSLRRTYPKYGPSGLEWLLYQRDDPKGRGR